MTLAQLQLRLQQLNLLPFHQIHITRCFALAAKGVEVKEAIEAVQAAQDSEALDAAHTVLNTKTSELNGLLADLSNISEMASTTKPNM